MSDDDKCDKCGKCGESIKSDVPDEVFNQWNKDLWDSLAEFEHLLANAMVDESLSDKGKAEIMNTGYFHIQCVAARIEGIMMGYYGKDTTVEVVKSIATEARVVIARQMVEALKKLDKEFPPVAESIPDPDKLN